MKMKTFSKKIIFPVGLLLLLYPLVVGGDVTVYVDVITFFFVLALGLCLFCMFKLSFGSFVLAGFYYSLVSLVATLKVLGVNSSISVSHVDILGLFYGLLFEIAVILGSGFFCRTEAERKRAEKKL